MTNTSEIKSVLKWQIHVKLSLSSKMTNTSEIMSEFYNDKYKWNQVGVLKWQIQVELSLSSKMTNTSEIKSEF
jgi:hypothetical protein